MPLRLDIKRKLSNRSERVKAVDFHPTEPWLLSALYNGQVNIWDYNQQTVLKYNTSWSRLSRHASCPSEHANSSPGLPF
jgi:WD40 repeat protein